MRTAFFTGFPGFLGSRLLPLVLRRDPELRAACLVQDKFEVLAKERVDALVAADPSLAGRIDLVTGDLTAPGLGLADGASLAANVEEVWHLAAVYDLSVPRELAMRVNVDGTRNILRFAEECTNLRRHHYVSTCYVSGNHCGPFTENDLDLGQRFSNFYEETKFLAEVDVAGARDGGMPTTIYRPAIVVGDSNTGETQKFDGPYFYLQWLLRNPSTALVPVVGNPDMCRFNVVPSNYVVDGIDALAAQAGTVNRTFQLADPNPPTVREMIDLMVEATGKRRAVKVPMPAKLTEWLLKNVGPLERFMGIPGSAVHYFVHPTHYGTAQTVAALEGTDVRCPHQSEYMPTLVEFMRNHRDANLGVMV